MAMAKGNRTRPKSVCGTISLKKQIRPADDRADGVEPRRFFLDFSASTCVG